MTVVLLQMLTYSTCDCCAATSSLQNAMAYVFGSTFVCRSTDAAKEVYIDPS